MKKRSRLDYAYSVGRVRALEKFLVNDSVFKEAALGKDISSAMKIIFDAGKFSEEMIEIRDSQELDEFIEREKGLLLNLMEKIILEREIVDILLNEHRPQVSLAIAKDVGYSFIVDYLRHKIDLGNLKIFCRIKYLSLPPQKLKQWIMEGGFVEGETFVKGFPLSLYELGDRLSTTPYHELWVRAVNFLSEKETFIILEREIEDFLMRFLQGAKFIVFGPEPVFAYAIAKRKELELIRLVGIGKLTQISPDILKERIHKTYV